jgi:putrescine transport system permease protein
VTATINRQPANPGRRLLLAWMVAIFVFLYLPIIVIIIYSFNGGRNLYVWTEWSTHWYGVAIDNPRALSALYVSIRTAPSMP